MALQDTLRALIPAEKEAFKLYLRSPFCTASVRNHKPENLLGLLEFLLENDGDDEDDSFDKAAVYARLFPEKKFAEATVNALASELHRLLKSFLQTLAADEAPEAASLLALARFYRSRGLEKDFLKTTEQLRRALEQTPPAARDLDFCLLAFQADYETCSWESHRNTKSSDAHFPDLLASLDIFYAQAKFIHAAYLLQQRHMVAFEAEEALPLAEIVRLAAGSARLLGVPTVRCFQKAIETMLAPDAENRVAQFADYQVLLQELSAEIPPQRLLGLLSIERSICARLYQSGRLEMLPRLFELYQRDLRSGHLYQSGGLNPAVFQNIVRAGLKLGQTDWVEHFLAKHPPERIVLCRFPEEVHRFNLANFHFHKKDYPRTLQCLQQRYEDNYYVLDANLLELKLYYERRNWSLLDNKLNSFKVNLYKKSKQWLPAARHEAINRFVDLLRQLTHDRIQMQKDPAAIERLRQKALESAVAEREWLLEKLDEA